MKVHQWQSKTNGSSEGEINQLGLAQPVEREEKSFTGIGISSQSGERR